MILFRRIITTIVLGIFLLLSKSSVAQCTQPAWDGNLYLSYSSGDTVSNDNRDWVAIPSGQFFREPSSATGHFGWTEISDPCASSTAPSVDSTEIRANYCRTSFAIGNIASDNGASITARGFVYGTTSGLDITNGNVLLDAGTGVGDEFEGLMENLTPETTYYVQTYATNSLGTTYGKETSFTTRADVDCVSECDLACDMTDSDLLDPDSASFPSIIYMTDTVCLTQDVQIGITVTIRGMLKLCNDAQLTFATTIDPEREENPLTSRGQIVYEGCNEKLIGTGSYHGDNISGEIDTPDKLQMISYCGSCDENDRTQFFDNAVDIDHWGATCRPTTTLLPVELIYFGASSHEEGVLLEWTTASETENSHFEVQLSYDGVNWATIGIAQGAGNSTEEINYSFIDNQIGDGVQYYRLKQLDFDGTSHHSNVRYFSFDSKEEPKPFIAFQNEDHQVEVQAKFKGMGEAILLDTRGRVVERRTFISSNNAGTKIVFDAPNLTQGIYLVRIKSGNALLGEKVQITK